MPLVEISVTETRSPAERRKLADAVHLALVETIDIPPNDRFQALTVHPQSELISDPGYLGIARSADPVFIRITLRSGRPLEKKRALYRAIAERAEQAIAVRREDVLVVLVENQSSDWSFGNGVAQYVTSE